MNEKTKKSIKECRTFDELLDVQYGPKGSPRREEFERDAEAFIQAERHKMQPLVVAH